MVYPIRATDRLVFISLKKDNLVLFLEKDIDLSWAH